MTNKLFKAIKVIAIIAASVLGGIFAYAGIGKELDAPMSVELWAWLIGGVEYIFSGTAIAAIGVVISTIAKFKTSNAEVISSTTATTLAVNAEREELKAQNAELVAEVKNANAEMKASNARSEAQTKQIKQLRGEMEEMKNNLALNLELNCAFMDSTTNNQKVKDIVAKFRTNKLIKQLDLPVVQEAIEEADTAEIKPLDLGVAVQSVKSIVTAVSSKEPVISKVSDVISVVGKVMKK